MKKWKTLFLMVGISLLVAACGEDNGGTTEPEDTPPSPVLSKHPPGNATDVARDAVVTATFREDMDSLSINSTTFTLQYNPPVSGTVAYDKNTRTATFTPDSLLRYSTTYTATITTGAKNSSGTPLASDYSWRFTIYGVRPGASLPRTGQIASYGSGDDGDVEAGVAWPTPRFIDNMNGTVTDELTGLMWLKDGSCLGYQSWKYSSRWAIDSLNFDPGSTGCQTYTGGYSDWRLPNVNELESLVHAGQSNTASWLNSLVFTSVQALDYWSSTTSSEDLGDALTVSMWTGAVNPNDQNTARPLLAVRGETTTPALVWKTGQVTSYRPGDDGELQEGFSWPIPRFGASSSPMIADFLTGLIWSRDAGTPTDGSCTGGRRTWQEALDYIECLNTSSYAGSSDWRLPNRKEFFSLIDRSQLSPALPSGHHFENVQPSSYYWTSTTYAYGTNRAWVIDMRDGDMGPRDKTGNAWVWPVRGGQ
jgi:hypothetical protein